MPVAIVQRSLPTSLFFCGECGEKKIGEGYAEHQAQPLGKVCYKCCAVFDWEYMQEDGRAVLYLAVANYEVTNWPGSLRFRVERHRVGKHNIGGIRHDVWFSDADDHQWHGVNVGRLSQLVHCHRLKNKQHSMLCSCWKKPTKQGSSK